MGSEMDHWVEAIDFDHPCWRDHRELLQQLEAREFPDCDALNRLLPGGLASSTGEALHFVPSDSHTPGPYERRITESGRISTRENNWHDLFNALSWALLPQIKRAMNTMHSRPHSDTAAGGRGRVRDALTLFDECGLMVASADRALLEELSRRRWSDVFHRSAEDWNDRVTLVVVGHALLEKCLCPYKSMTANALLLHISEDLHKLRRPLRISRMDTLVAKALLEERLLDQPSRLSPVPVMGIPGWSPGNAQDPGFYRDHSVFRPLRRGQVPAPVQDFSRIS